MSDPLVSRYHCAHDQNMSILAVDEIMSESRKLCSSYNALSAWCVTVVVLTSVFKKRSGYEIVSVDGKNNDTAPD